MFAAVPECAGTALSPSAAATVGAGPVGRRPGLPAPGAPSAAGASGAWRSMWISTAAAVTADIRPVRRQGC